MTDERIPTPHLDPPPNEVVSPDAASKPLVTVNFEREVDVSTGKGETRRFVKMYFEARDSGLLAAMPDELWKTLCVLATYLDENGHCFPSQDQLAKDLGIGRQAANKRIQRLRQFRFNEKPIIGIARSTVPQGIGGARRDKNLYQLYPIAGFHFGGKREQEKPQHSQMSRLRDNRCEPVRPVSRCRVDQTSGQSDSNKNNDNDLNVNVDRIASNKTTTTDATFATNPRQADIGPISHSALQKRYGLNDKQCGEVHYLVELQERFLGAAAQNHNNYIHRAATVAQLQFTGRFAAALRDFDEHCKKIAPRKGRPQLFHVIWRDQQDAYLRLQQNPAAKFIGATVATLSTRSIPALDSCDRDNNLDPQEQRRRQYIAQLETEGYILPPHIRGASMRDIAKWLDQHPDPVKNPTQST